MRVLLFCLVTIGSVWGQAVPKPPIFRFPGAIHKYLELTDAQALKISQQNSEFGTWSSVRSQRMYEVQFEIGVETAREPLDPAALGVRYAEVEAIRREIAERNAKLIAANLAVLTPAQVVKLKALEEAMKLAPTGSEAQALKLLPDSCSVARVFISGINVVPTDVIRVPFPGYGLGGFCAPQATFDGPFLP